MEVSTEKSEIMTNSTNNISADISMNCLHYYIILLLLEEVASFKYWEQPFVRMAHGQQKSASGFLSDGSNGQTKQDLAAQHHQLCKQVQAVQLQVSCHLHPPPLAVKHGPCLLTQKKMIQALETKHMRKVSFISYLEHKIND